MISKNRLKTIAALQKKKIRAQEGKFLIEGIRMCREALLSDFEIESFLVRTDLSAQTDVEELQNLAVKRRVEIIEISAKDADILSETVHSQGVFCIVKQKETSIDQLVWEDFTVVVIIDAGQDPGNVGTIIRTCDWFGVDAVFLCSGTAELYNPKVIRSTMGSVFHVQVIQNIDQALLLADLKNRGYSLYGADANGEIAVNRVNYSFPLALIVGNENRGLSPAIQNLLDKTVFIPGKGSAESLNMAAATAIIISHILNR